MHIVYVSREYPPTLRGGGIAGYVRDMAEYLVSIGHLVTVICASDDTRTSYEESREDGLHIIRLSKGDFVIPSIEGNSLLKKTRCITRFKSYRRKIRETILKLNNVDIIEVPEYGAESLYLTKLPFPIVIRLHTPSFFDRKACSLRSYSISKKYEHYVAAKEMKILKQSRYITSCSKSLSEWIQNNLCLNIKIACIYNPLKTDNWIKNTKCEYKKPFSILFVGTVAEAKGVNTLITACRLLKNSGISVTLTIVGKLGLYGEKLKNDIASKKEDWCHFTGNIERNSLLKFYHSHEVSCFPSFWENLPMVCLEAMCAKSLVLASSRGGMSEIIEEGKSDFLFPPMNPKKLAQKLTTVFSLDENTKSRIRNEAHIRIRNTFSTSVIVPQILRYYKEVITDYHESNTNTLD